MSLFDAKTYTRHLAWNEIAGFKLVNKETGPQIVIFYDWLVNKNAAWRNVNEKVAV